MTGSSEWSVLALLGLGLWHGLNPGMGWLFAVALGMQERRASAVWRSLPPLAAGHALAVVMALTAALLLGLVVPHEMLRWGVAGILVGFGAWRLLRGCRTRWVGMRVGARELISWSLLMASAHGAGLMVIPLVLGTKVHFAAGNSHAARAALFPGPDAVGPVAIWATLAHTAGYLVATGAVALLVYRKLGLRLLGRLWLNLDLVWGAALVLTGLLTPALGG